MPGGVYFKQPQHISTGMLLFDAFHGTQGPEFCTLQTLLVHQEFFFFSLMLAMGPRPLVPFEKEMVTISDKGSHPGGVCKGGCQN